MHTPEDFMSEKDKVNKEDVEKKIEISLLPEYIFQQYKVISRIDKINLYNQIRKLENNLVSLESIRQSAYTIQYNHINKDGFQVIFDTIYPIIKNEKLKSAIEFKGLDNQYKHSVLVYQLDGYLNNRFRGAVDFRIKRYNETLDKAINETAKFVYNTLKYQLVKYLGVFNIIYKYYIAQRNETTEDKVVGFERLLSKLEYNAFSNKAKLASDYGTPHSIVEYYEHIDTNKEKANQIKNRFDSFEKKVFSKIDVIINNN